MPEQEDDMLFAALVLDREPLQWGQLFTAANLWVQNAGSIVAVPLGIWLLVQMLNRNRPFAAMLSDAPPSWVGPLSMQMTLMAALSFLGFLAVGLIGLGAILSPRAMADWIPQAGRIMPPGSPPPPLTVGDYILSASGLLALLVALTPMLLGLTRLRGAESGRWRGSASRRRSAAASCWCSAS